MRHITTGLLALSLCCGVASVTACDNLPLTAGGHLGVSQKASLKVLLGGDLVSLRQTQATVDDIDHIDLSLVTSSSEATQSLTKAQLIDASASITFTNLTAGSATLKGIVYDEEGLILGEKSTGVTLVDGQTATTSLAIQLNPELNHPAVPPATSQTSLSVTNGITSNNTAAVSTFAGAMAGGYQEGTGVSALFKSPSSVSLDSVGNVYVADASNGCVRKITPGGVSSLIASGSVDSSNIYLSTTALDPSRNRLYYVDFTYGRIVYTTMSSGGSKTRLGTVSVGGSRAMATDRQGNVYVAHGTGNRVVKVSPTGEELPFAGSSASAGLSNPEGVAVDSAGNVFISDTNNHRIVKVSKTGVVSTLAGGTQGFADGIGAAAKFSYPKGLAVDSAGSVYVADFSNTRVRKISRSGEVITIAGSSSSGLVNATGGAARFGSPGAVAVDPNGVIYVADIYNNVIRKIQ